MPTPIKGLEKEYILREALGMRQNVSLSLGTSSWTVHFVELRENTIFFNHTIPLQLLAKGTAVTISYETKGNTITFNTAIVEPGNKIAGILTPEILYKDLSRKFTRLPPPSDLGVSFSVKGERYKLDFPSIENSATNGVVEISSDFDAKNLRGLMVEFARKADLVASTKKIIMFSAKKPETISEKLCSNTGKTLFLPNTMSGIPQSDPFAEKTIITNDDCTAWFLDSGLDAEHAEEQIKLLVRSIRNQGILSMLTVPILFQNYTIGLIELAVKDNSKPYIDLNTVETFVSFARVLSHALYIHHYFKTATKIDTDFTALVVDVSAGGLLFSSQDADLLANLQDASEVNVQLETKKRTVQASGKIKRHYAGKAEGYFGIEFTIMAPEDFRFLFEYLYGRSFTDEDASSIESSRIHHP